MNTLLPKSEQEFSEVNYWERFFKNRSKSFDWYGDYVTLSELFQKYVKLKDNILIVGCGNSTLSYDLYNIQKCHRICSIDISKTAIDQMKLKYKNIICPITNKYGNAFDYKCVDVCSFSKDDDIKKLLPMNCIVDKGTTDAIHSGGESSEKIIINMWNEIRANLDVMGLYVLITLAQSHIVDSIIEYFLKENGNQWMVNVHEILSKTSSDRSFSLPVFAFIFFKMKPSSSLPMIYIEENSFSKSNVLLQKNKKLVRISTEKLKEWILSRQQLSLLSHSIQESGESECVINMQSSKSKLVRYHCIVVRNKFTLHKKSSNNLPYCVFIVPFGFNSSDIVNDKQARFKLCKDHLKSRVCLFVYLNPRENYGNKQMIQDELNSVAVTFCPVEVPENYSIPYVSCHDFIYNSKIENYGEIFMEYLETPNETYSRLIAPCLTTAVIVADKPISLRDKLISEFIELLQSSITGESGLYCGQSNCTSSLNNQWKLYLSSCENSILDVINSKFKINCIRSNDLFGEFNWLIYDSNVFDKGLVKQVLKHLSAEGVIIICCDNSMTFEELAVELSLKVIFSCTTNDKFGGDKSYFSIMSKTSRDAKLWRESFEKFLW